MGYVFKPSRVVRLLTRKNQLLGYCLPQDCWAEHETGIGSLRRYATCREGEYPNRLLKKGAAVIDKSQDGVFTMLHCGETSPVRFPSDLQLRTLLKENETIYAEWSSRGFLMVGFTKNREFVEFSNAVVMGEVALGAVMLEGTKHDTDGNLDGLVLVRTQLLPDEIKKRFKQTQ